MNIFTVLLTIHICFGTLSLLCAAGALCATKGAWWHRHFGEFFFYGMTGVFVTAIPMSIIISSVFLFSIAIFSYYLAFTGWRYARNTSGVPAKIDWFASIMMLIVGIGMVIGGWYLYKSNPTHATILLVFGGIGALLSKGNLKIYLRGGAQGKERIVQHFSSMIGATIAAVTAFVVTNFHFEPVIVLWLAPTVALVPVIFWWRKKIGS
jgi:hypothetical protein